MRRRFAALCALLAGLGLADLALANPRFDVIEPLPGAGTSDALGVSGDGCRVVGHSDFEAFSWRDGDTSPLPAPNPQIAYAVTPDGRVVVGYAGHHFFRMDEAGLERIHVPGGAGNPTEARAVSADGWSAGGCTHATEVGMHCDWPFLWKSGTGSALLPGVSGGMEVGSVEAISADGAIAAGAAGGRAVIWHPDAGTVQDLGALPGHTQGEVRDLTPDGAVAVGRSGPESHSGARAFRWTAASGMVELGSDARVAHAVSADGQRIVGDGPLGAFLWDPGNGVRALADVLRDDYGLDLGGFQLDSATAISPDGQTIVGSGGVPGGSRRGWRARLHEEPCPQPPMPPPVDLLEYAPPSVQEPTSLRIDALGRLSVSGLESRNVVRIDTDLATHGNPVIETLLDFRLDPLPDPDAWDVPIVLATGADGSVYVGAYLRRQLLRIAPDGTVHVAFDGSGHPPLGDEFYPLFTAPTDAKFGPDGSLYVAADARVVRIDPDGSVHELIDAAAAQEAGTGRVGGPVDLGLYFVEVDTQGRVFVTGGIFVLVLDRDGNLLDSFEPSELTHLTIRGIEADTRGALWLYGDAQLSRLDPDGTVEDIFLWDIPDGAGGTFSWGIRDLVVDGASNVYYTNGEAIVRRTPEGVLTRVLAPETLDIHEREVGPLSVVDMTLSGNLLFAADSGRDRVFRVELPPLPAACENGFDDDGDGVVDFGADPGCTSANDDGEREASLTCDNGLDDDADGIADYPADTSCASRTDTELPECSDGLDNDGDGAVDWNGAPDGVPADPECGGDPMRVIEHGMYCGLGFEVALLLPLIAAARRWRRCSN